jgi:hypothetical protein
MTAQPSYPMLYGGWQSGQQRCSDAYQTRRWTMRFLVQGEWVETGAVLPAEQFAPLIEHVVLPSLERWDHTPGSS